MKRISLFGALLSAVAVAAPLSAQASMADVEAYIDLIQQSGTQISFNENSFDKNCIDRAGYYHLDPGKQDLLVVCVSQVDEKDPDAVWEALAHESTHIMQACSETGYVFKPEYHPRIVRHLQSKAPHYSKMIDTTYKGRSQLQETEAFYMELQPPSDVMGAFTKLCFKAE
jgi:hypothetical protein